MSFPLDWDEWRREWSQWCHAHQSDLVRTSSKFPGTNFLADEVLGTWKVNGRVVELSEVVFPNLSERDPQTGRLLGHNVRGVGLTFEDHRGAVVHSFEELEAALGMPS